MSNLTKRIITAVVLVAVLLLTLFILPPPAGVTFFALFLAIAAWEWAGFCSAATSLQRVVYVVLLALLAFDLSAGYILASQHNLVLGVGVVYWLLALAVMVFGLQLRGRLLTAVAGAVALLVAWVAVNQLLALENGSQLFVWCAALVAAADIGAYFTGKSIGRNKLAPTISPGKTIEGFAGGVCSAALVGALGAGYFDLPALLFAAVGALIAGISVVGDLWVSRFKRAAGLKDSGRVLPGHGGVMDRIDSLIAALPLFVLALGLNSGGSV